MAADQPASSGPGRQERPGTLEDLVAAAAAQFARRGARIARLAEMARAANSASSAGKADAGIVDVVVRRALTAAGRASAPPPRDRDTVPEAGPEVEAVVREVYAMVDRLRVGLTAIERSVPLVTRYVVARARAEEKAGTPDAPVSARRVLEGARWASQYLPSQGGAARGEEVRRVLGDLVRQGLERAQRPGPATP
jgi:hypothetical protein